MPKPLTIVHIIPELNLKGGGVNTFIKTLIYCLVDQQNKNIIKNIIVTNQSDELDRKDFQALGTPVFSRLMASQLDQGKPLEIIQWMTQILKQLQPDLVNTHLFWADTLGRKAAVSAGVPVIITRECNVNLNETAKHRKIKRDLANITDCIVCNAEAVRKYADEVEGIPPHCLEVIHNGVLLEKYECDCSYDHQKPLEFVYVGRLEPQKNPLLLINAFAAIIVDYPDCRLSIIGDGSLKEECLNQVKTLGLSEYVRFLGYNKKPWDWVNPGSVSILTSSFEGLPNAVLEAMAAGIICIVPKLAVMSEIAKAGSELIIYEVGNQNKLIEAMKFLLEMTPEEKLLMIRAARTRVEQDFDAHKMADKYLNLYQTIYRNKVLTKHTADKVRGSSGY
ncbi:glycosyltransferase [Moorena producens JHB]|uniref:Glycosyltransferase n=1 Tax=Moorena producens (strain JHB) TaxID=1454205 RepID=A0A1D9FY65_MOOP1|nr:glycosyltransferase [Moorena producens]AOY80309.1 glycosyltransferase [Moorena producens JHB]